MRLYHATPARNLDSIQAVGLDPNRSRGAKKEVWLHTASRREWAILHTTQRHNCEVSEVVIIEVEVPRSRLRRRWRGLWTIPEPITEYQSITNARALTKSPLA